MEKCKFEMGKKYCSIDFETIEIISIQDGIVTFDFEGILETLTISQANLVYDAKQFGECR